MLCFEYNTDGTPLGFVLNDTQYIYITNNSGDVIAIADSTGSILATYSYDEWGKVTVNATGDENTAIANLNPLRYRGYYYDNETGYYYLQSRYYAPEICRFINADLPEYASEQKNEKAGINVFVYCCNDATNNSDKNGHKKGKKHTYVFIYNGKSTLVRQAKNSYYYDYYSDSVIAKYVKSVEDFVKAWNSMSNIDDIYLYLHGGDGHLTFEGKGQEIYVSSMDKKLNKKTISGQVYLFSCHGGGGCNTYNVAYELSKKTDGKPVYAAKVGVSYSKSGKKYYARIEKKYFFSLAVNTYWYCFKAYIEKGKWKYSSMNLKIKRFKFD